MSNTGFKFSLSSIIVRIVDIINFHSDIACSITNFQDEIRGIYMVQRWVMELCVDRELASAVPSGLVFGGVW